MKDLIKTIRESQDLQGDEIDMKALVKAWGNAKGTKQKNNVIAKFKIPSAFSKNRGGEIKLGHSHDLKLFPHREIVVHDDSGELFVLTGKPMKLFKFGPYYSGNKKIKEEVDFADLVVVDYMATSGTDIDPDGILAYQSHKRHQSMGGGPSEDVVEESVELEEGFDRLPGHVINNELYDAQQRLKDIYSRMTGGNDFKKKDLTGIIKDLQSIVKSAKTFSKAEDVPLSFQYKKESVELDDKTQLITDILKTVVTEDQDKITVILDILNS